MAYRVLWSPNAEDRLEYFLEDEEVADALANAARELDRQLLAHPTSLGESRYDTVRIGFAHPLGIQFEVMEDVRTVIVYDVWRIDQK